jgi:RNA recognition motif-containing protein
MASQTASDYANDNSSSDKSKKTLYLSGLSLKYEFSAIFYTKTLTFFYSTDNEGLSAFFSRFGKVKNCHVMLREEGKSRCCAFLNYESKVKLRKLFEKIRYECFRCIIS